MDQTNQESKKIYSLDEIFSRAWNVFTKNFQLFLLISFLAYLPVVFIGLFNQNVLRLSGSFAVMMLFSMFLLMFFMSILKAIAVIYITEKGFYNKSIDFRLLLKQSLSKWSSVFFVDLVTVVFVFGLTLLFIVPGIIYAIYWSFAVCATVLRDKTGTNALKYSKNLVKGRWWTVFGYFLIITFVVGLVAFGFSFIKMLLFKVFFSVSFKTMVEAEKNKEFVPFSMTLFRAIFDFLQYFIFSFAAVAETVFFINLDEFKRAENEEQVQEGGVEVIAG